MADLDLNGGIAADEGHRLEDQRDGEPLKEEEQVGTGMCHAPMFPPSS